MIEAENQLLFLLGSDVLMSGFLYYVALVCFAVAFLCLTCALFLRNFEKASRLSSMFACSSFLFILLFIVSSLSIKFFV